MADELSVVAVREGLKEITDCYVCSQTYEDPKILQCVHTFCMKCLKATGDKIRKRPGDQIPCPICRKEFAIPAEGYTALQKNFFMEKLIEMAKMPRSLKGPDLCEACTKDSESASSSGVPLADVYCTQCRQKLCQECSRHHRKNKLTRNHQIVAAVDFQDLEQSLVGLQSYCRTHVRVHMLYCSDCKKLLCMSCFDEVHQNHKQQTVSKFVEGCKNEIQNSLHSLEVCESKVYEKKENLMLERKRYSENVENLKLQILAQREATIKLANEHANLLIQEIDLLKTQKLQEVQAEIEDTELYLTSLESFKDCCSLAKTGLASYVCSVVDKLKARAEELKEQHEPKVEIRSRFPKMSFRVSDLEEFVKTENYNIIGATQECQTEAEVEEVKMEDSCVRPFSGNNGIQARFKQLNRELENERRRIRGLEMEKETFEKRINELELELGIKRPKCTIFEPFVPRLVPREISINYRRTPKLVKMLNSLESGRSVNGDEVCGLAILDNELLLGSNAIGSVVEVYDIKTFNFRRLWRIERMLPYRCQISTGDTHISCMASCSRHKCLYVCVYSSGDISRCQSIRRSDVYGSNAREWKIDVGSFVLNLSVTGEGNVIVTDCEKNTLLEYSRNGELVHEVKLSWSLAIQHPLHALKLANGSLVVIFKGRLHGLGGDFLHRVVVVSESGQVTKSYGAMSVSDKEHSQVCRPKPLTEPVCLSMDRSGNVLVADRGSNSILVLNSDLEFMACLNPCPPFQKPNCLCVDPERRLLFVCEDQKRISVYDLFCF